MKQFVLVCVALATSMLGSSQETQPAPSKPLKPGSPEARAQLGGELQNLWAEVQVGVDSSDVSAQELRRAARKLVNNTIVVELSDDLWEVGRELEKNTLNWERIKRVVRYLGDYAEILESGALGLKQSSEEVSAGPEAPALGARTGPVSGEMNLEELEDFVKKFEAVTSGLTSATAGLAEGLKPKESPTTQPR